MAKTETRCTLRVLSARTPRSADAPAAAAPPLEPETVLRESRGTCREPRVRAILLSYSADQASPPERAAFERHMISCDECVDDLVAVWRVTDLLDGWRTGPDGTPVRVLPGLVRDARRRRRVRLVVATLLAAAAGFVLRGLA